MGITSQEKKNYEVDTSIFSWSSHPFAICPQVSEKENFTPLSQIHECMERVRVIEE